MKNEQLMIQRSRHWLDAAIGCGLLIRIQGLGKRSAPSYLLQLSRLQYACELSYERIQEASELTERAVDVPTKMAGIGRLFLDIHAFLVSAHSYWRILAKLNALIELGDLAECVKNNSAVAHDTKTARDHLEHLVERISIGRPKKFGPAMLAETFRGSMGRFHKGCITFGNEIFCLGKINSAIQTVGQLTARVVEDAFSPNSTVSVTEDPRAEPQ